MDTPSRTYAPIASSEPVQGSRWLRRRTLATPGFAAVLHREGGPLRVVWPIRRDDDTEKDARWLQNYDTVFRVDIGYHLLDYEVTVPSKDETLGLGTHVWFTCNVQDPAVIVERKTEDARSAVEPLLLPKIRAAGRGCSVERCDEAERTIREALPDPMDAAGFRLSHFLVTVTPDEAARRYLEEQREEAERKRRKQEEAELEEQRERTKAAEAEELRQNKRNEVRDDVKFYADLLHRADTSTMWAILLAQNPGAAGQLVDRVNRQLESRQEVFHSLLRSFLEGRGMEDYQVEQAVRVLWELLMQETAPGRVLREPLLIGNVGGGASATPAPDEPDEDSPKAEP